MDAAIDAVVRSSQCMDPADDRDTGDMGVDAGPVTLPVQRETGSGGSGSMATIVQLMSNEIGELRDIVCKQQDKINLLLSLMGLGPDSSGALGSAATCRGDLLGGTYGLPTGGSSGGLAGVPSDALAEGLIGAPTASFGTFGQFQGGAGRSTTGHARIRRVPVPGVVGGTEVPLSLEFRRSVVSAVYQDFDDRDRRARNIVVSGLSPVDAVDDQAAVAELIFREFNRIPDIVRCRRLGQPRDGRIQKLLVVLRDEDQARTFLHGAKRLRQSSDDSVRSSVYLNPDVTPAESHAAYVIRSERRRRLETMRGARALAGRASAAAIDSLPVTSSRIGFDRASRPSGAPSVGRQDVSVAPVVPGELSAALPAAADDDAGGDAAAASGVGGSG